MPTTAATFVTNPVHVLGLGPDDRTEERPLTRPTRASVRVNHVQCPDPGLPVSVQDAVRTDPCWAKLQRVREILNNGK